MKTTCSVESWNSHFQKFFKGNKPSIDLLIKKLQHMQKRSEIRLSETNSHCHMVTQNKVSLQRAARAQETLTTPIREGCLYEHLLAILPL